MHTRRLFHFFLQLLVFGARSGCSTRLWTPSDTPPRVYTTQRGTDAQTEHMLSLLQMQATCDVDVREPRSTPVECWGLSLCGSRQVSAVHTCTPVGTAETSRCRLSSVGRVKVDPYQIG